MKTLEQLYLQRRGKVSDTESRDLAEYDRILAAYRDRPINLLEIGVRNGGSLEIWSEFFRNANKLVGCDINPESAGLGSDPRIAMVVGDANLDETVLAIANHAERFDIVIADASHASGDIVKSFLRYFPKLEDGGIFLVEDLHRADEQDLDGGRHHADSPIAFFKLLESIHSVEFVNSACVIRKLPAAQNSDLQQNVKRLERQILFLQDDVARRDAGLASLQQKMDVLLHSVSWRVTAPLRWPGASLLRIRHLTGVVGRAVRASGGFKPMIRKVVSLYRREGFSGLRNGFRQRRDLSQESAKRNDYDEWIERYDCIDDEQRAAIQKRIAVMPDRPLISVVMPTYNPKPEWLKEAIESIRNQLYPNWELCIADDLSTDPAIRPLLEQMSSEDSRIKVIFREQNGHISAASNSALQLATGDWVALLDHDDLLPEHALYCVANAIVANPSARLIYSDEDKMDAAGRRHDPYFKCDWNRDLFYSQNFFSHLGVYHKALLDTVGGFRIGIEGSQDYDLVLRCIEHIDDDAIHHIPRVLYHWRVHAESTAGGADAKPYAALAGERALNEHFARRGVAASVEWITRGYHAHYSLPATLPLVSLIIPTRNALKLMRQCIDSIVGKTTYSNYEIIVVDNGSDDPEALRYFESLGEDARIRVLRDDSPFNYSALNNSAVAQARGELVALINNDIEVISPDWLSEMVSLALQPGVGAVGAKLYYPNDTLQHGGVVLGIAGVAGHANKHAQRPAYGYFGRTCLIGSYSAVTAACLVIRKSIYQEVGGLNEKDLTIAFNDIDFCLRIREAGYRNVWTPYAELYHHESATRGDEINPQRRVQFLTEIAYMQQRWGEVLSRDPAYSPNLTLDYEDFSLAWPPRVEALGRDVASS
ncbi:Glycosyltransferase, GT2 family [Paraburkholderia phenazinium]|jgi:glycosyltransferase involved in cell wall biosynthesis/cephalosporin hydroxylase|uniref:Glycosyltransferase, GT2 family n=1 Tax=Paraburkholderia phenazinium TaxID=60549 RepID=A0A1N6I1Y1_9BURK|nr:Glycosyltransferase, GT2 family [Paraburkholderia phenazinium]